MAKKIEITNNIRKHRFFTDGMTQQHLAEKCGVSRQTINAIEAGKYCRTSLRTIQKMREQEL